jgi:hypothetical protein
LVIRTLGLRPALLVARVTVGGASSGGFFGQAVGPRTASVAAVTGLPLAPLLGLRLLSRPSAEAWPSRLERPTRRHRRLDGRWIDLHRLGRNESRDTMLVRVPKPWYFRTPSLEGGVMLPTRAGVLLLAVLFTAGCSASANNAPLSGQQKIESLLSSGYEVRAGEDGYGLIDVFLQKGSSLYLCEGSQQSYKIRTCHEIKS